MAVAGGGTLHQHLPDLIGHEPAPGRLGHRPARRGLLAYGRHDVVVQPGSRAHDLLGAPLTVNSFHHQAVGRTRARSRRSAGAPTTGSSRSSRTGARVRAGRPVAPGAHPDLRVFAALAEAAARRSRRPHRPAAWRTGRASRALGLGVTVLPWRPVIAGGRCGCHADEAPAGAAASSALPRVRAGRRDGPADARAGLGDQSARAARRLARRAGRRRRHHARLRAQIVSSSGRSTARSTTTPTSR
jgi:hypothetical protein